MRLHEIGIIQNSIEDVVWILLALKYSKYTASKRGKKMRIGDLTSWYWNTFELEMYPKPVFAALEQFHKEGLVTKKVTSEEDYLGNGELIPDDLWTITNSGLVLLKDWCIISNGTGVFVLRKTDILKDVMRRHLNNGWFDFESVVDAEINEHNVLKELMNNWLDLSTDERVKQKIRFLREIRSLGVNMQAGDLPIAYAER
jgi:hypothetical protein